MKHDRQEATGTGELWVAGDGPAPAWAAIASGEARLDVTGAGRPGLPPLRLSFDFGSGGGFVVARTAFDLALPETWELSLRIRGEAPANTLEIKLADPAGTSVWRWKREAFAPSSSWSELRLPGHAFEFAWGPLGGGAPSRVSALEIALVAPPGGSGVVEVADLRLIDRGQLRLRRATATSGASDGANHAWRSAPGDASPALTLEFDEPRDLGGLELRWADGGAPASFAVDTCDAAGTWTTAYSATAPGAPRSFVPMAVEGATALRLSAGGPVALGGLAVKPFGWSRTPSEFLTNVAKASRRGDFPRYLLREQALWTPVASPTSGPLALLSDDGAVEMGEGGFSLEPSLVVATTDGPRRIGWADVERSALQEDGPLPVATVRWKAGALELGVTAVVDAGGVVLVRHRVRNTGEAPLAATLMVAVRPFQVTPPWQAFRGLGGPRRIDAIACSGPSLRLEADGLGATLACRPAPAAAGATCFDAGGLRPWLDRDEVPASTSVRDPHAMAEAALRFPLQLAPSSFADVFVAGTTLPVDARMAQAGGAARDAASPDAAPPADAAHDVASPDPAAFADAARVQAALAGDGDPVAAALAAWRGALPLHGAVDGAASGAFAVATTAIAHVLACRDGAALQPGPRRYTRSWIRDGAIMAASLARAGRGDTAAAFVDWYAPFQRSDGFVPCCVDRDGADPLVEHDSHGQLIHAVAETFRFTRDVAFAARHWPACARAAAYIEALRDTRRTAEFASGPRRACFGLLPESVSHEGYLAQPVHAYWDDFWALRGLRDAAFLAASLGLGDDAKRWSEAAAGLGEALAESVRTVMRERGVETVPSSVEWADFDPTAIAGALSLTGGAEFLPQDALAKTFDLYMDGFRARQDPSRSWSNYSPYEARIVGALVRLGRRDDANAVLDGLLADCRPRAWRQWPEILWKDDKAPAHLGDLPHCWIGAEYAHALRSMLVLEREADGALVIGAGLRREWLDAGLEARGLPTWWGSLDVTIAPDGRGGYRVATGGDAAPPGGFVAALPGAAVVDAGAA